MGYKMRRKFGGGGRRLEKSVGKNLGGEISEEMKGGGNSTDRIEERDEKSGRA